MEKKGLKMSLFDSILQKQRNIHKRWKVSSIPNIQKKVCEQLPDLFSKKAFFKMQPRPCENELAREYAYYKYCMSHVEVDGLWLEFGVYNGVSIKFLNKMKKEMYPDSEYIFHGFDSFEGLPEDWKGSLKTKKGDLKSIQVPNIKGVEFHKGWFKDTIPEFVKTHSEPCAFVHIDCDLYSSTVDVLENLSDQIVPGTVILFDELIGYNAWKIHEYKAFMEFVKKYDIEYEWIAFVANAGQAACKITRRNK